MTDDYRSRSFWLDDVATSGDSLTPRAPLPGARDVDVAIVGAGYTGLWTAHYLLDRDPTLRIAVLEKEIAGFGASGRNGGWCSALFPASMQKIAAASSRDGAIAMRRAMYDSVDEVGNVTTNVGIDCDFDKGGTLSLIRSRAQLARAKAKLEDARAWGATEVRPRTSRPRRDHLARSCDRCTRRAFHPALRSDSSSEARAGAGRTRGATRRSDLRGHRGDGHLAAPRRHTSGRRASRRRRARDRGLHADDPWTASRVGAGVFADARHRAAT